MNQKYLSKYSNGKYVSAAQYITELICENKAIKDKLDLHYRFWTTKRWEYFYRNQIASANKLLETYDANAIIKALVSDSGRRIYSLRAPHLKPMIDQCASEISSANTKLTKTFNKDCSTDFRTTHKSNNIISKLKDIDNEF